MQVLKQFIADMVHASSVEELRDLYSAAVKKLGYHAFDAFSVKSGTTDNADQPVNLFICDYNIQLPRSYVRDGWLQMDPVTAEISRTSTPFDYVAHLKNSKINSSVKWQLGVLRILNIQHAWEVPLCLVGHMRGMTIYMRGGGAECETTFYQTRDEIHLMSVSFMETFVRLSNRPVVEDEEWYVGDIDFDAVSQRETDCLHWAARGKTNWEIGEILKISENTVRFHLKNAFAKLRANSRSSAVSRALQGGIIEL